MLLPLYYLLAALLTFGTGYELGSKDGSQLERNFNTAYQIQMEEGTGSAVAIGVKLDRTYLLTNEHVCQAADPLKGMEAVDTIGFHYQARVEKESPDQDLVDLCLLSIKDYHQIADIAYEITFPEEVYTIGGPGGIFPVMSGGYQSGPSWISTQSWFGSSGSGVFSKKTGELVGVISSIRIDDSMGAKQPVVVQMVSLDEVRRFIKDFL